MKLYKLVFLILVFFIIGSAEESDSLQNMIAPKLYVDCDYCDDNHIRENVNFVNYVIDRKEADIYLLVTVERTGSGGRKYSLIFLGENNYISQDDTLYFTIRDDESWDDTREKMVNTLKLGLIPYISKTPIAQDIEISYKKSESSIVKKDKWDNWVFRSRFGGHFSGEESSEEQSYGARFSANRITDDWKIRIDFDYDYDKEIEKNIEELENETITVVQKEFDFDFLLVKSINSHWSGGMFFEGTSDTYSNTKQGYSFSPAIEYNIFPYSEASRKEFSIRYGLGVEHFNYRDTTIYNKIKETLLMQGLSMDIRFKQPWGEIDFSLHGSNYFPDIKKNKLGINNHISLHLFKGFSFSIHGGASIIHDQLSLEKGEVTLAERLLNIKEIETSYSYWFGIGIEYTFGSIYNNIVNPRF